MPRVTFIAAWYDFWVGAFWDARKRRLYVLPVPCLGVVLQFPVPCRECDGHGWIHEPCAGCGQWDQPARTD